MGVGIAKRFVGWGWNRFGERMEEIVAISGEVVGSVFGYRRDWDSITQVSTLNWLGLQRDRVWVRYLTMFCTFI